MSSSRAENVSSGRSVTEVSISGEWLHYFETNVEAKTVDYEFRVPIKNIESLESFYQKDSSWKEFLTWYTVLYTGSRSYDLLGVESSTILSLLDAYEEVNIPNYSFYEVDWEKNKKYTSELEPEKL